MLSIQPRKNCLTGLLFAFFILPYSQGQDDTRKIVFYFNGYYEFVDFYYPDYNWTFNGNISSFPVPSITLVKSREHKRYFHEFDFIPFYYYNHDYVDTILHYLDGYTLRRYESSIAYRFNYRLIQHEKLDVFLSVENKLFFIRNRYIPRHDNGFDHKVSKLGLGTSIGMGVEKRISKTVSMIITPLIGINELYCKFMHTYDPFLSERDRKTETFHEDFYPGRYFLKLGLAVTF